MAAPISKHPSPAKITKSGWSTRIKKPGSAACVVVHGTQNKAISRWNSERRCNAAYSEISEPSTPDDTYEKAMNSITLEQCWVVMRAMPPARYKVAYLRWHEGWTSTEVAQSLGITPSTVRVHLKNARDQLTEAVGPDVVFLTDPDDTVEPGEAAS